LVILKEIHLIVLFMFSSISVFFFNERRRNSNSYKRHHTDVPTS
jgi:hypothetical protein